MTGSRRRPLTRDRTAPRTVYDLTLVRARPASRRTHGRVARRRMTTTPSPLRVAFFGRTGRPSACVCSRAARPARESGSRPCARVRPHEDGTHGRWPYASAYGRAWNATCAGSRNSSPPERAAPRCVGSLTDPNHPAYPTAATAHNRPAPPAPTEEEPTKETPMGSIRVAVVGVGAKLRGFPRAGRPSHFQDADPASTVPGLMHVQFGPYHVRGVEFVAAFDVDDKKVGRTSPRRSTPREQHDQDLRRADDRRDRAARSYARRAREVLPPDHRRVGRGAGGRRPGAQGTQVDVLAPIFPVGSEEADQVLCAVRPRRGCRLRQRAAGLSSRATPNGRRSSRPRACRSSVTTSRARSDDDHPPVMGCCSGPRRYARPHLSSSTSAAMDFKNMLGRERIGSRRSPRPRP